MRLHSLLHAHGPSSLPSLPVWSAQESVLLADHASADGGLAVDQGGGGLFTGDVVC